MEWFLSVVRMAGASFPGAASFVQLQSELDAAELRRRIEALEDPISQLHPDVPAVGRLLYDSISATGSPKVQLPPEAYHDFSRPLAALEAAGLIEGTHAIGNRYVGGLWVRDPIFFLYLERAFGDPEALEKLGEEVDQCVVGRWLNGFELAEKHKVPLPVVNAVFQIYEARGFGLTSKTVGESRYRAMA